MNRIVRIVLASLAIPFCLHVQPVLADSGWSINNFHSEITIKPDGTADIQETIEASFDTDKHGIYRDIPYAYKSDSGTTYTKIDVLGISRDNTAEPYSLERSKSNIRMKIGSSKTTISGIHTYVIHYLATGILKGYAKYDELYWNVTGNGWEVPILTASARVTLPQAGIMQSSCYTGSQSSTTSCTTNRNDSTATYTTTSLSAYSGMTIALGYTKNMVPLLTVNADEVGNPFLHKTALYTFAILWLAGLFLLYNLWRRYGADNLKNESIAPEYASPDNLRPAEIGLLIDQRADTIDVSATIVDLAVRGFLTIAEEPKKWLFGSTDYVFTLLTKSQDQLMGYERMLLNHLFEDGSTIKLSSLRNTFFTDLEKIKNKLYEEETGRGLFPQNPQTMRTKYILAAFGVLFASAVIIFVSAAKLITLHNQATYLVCGFLMALVATSFSSVFFAYFMPRRTPRGHELYRRSMGYKLFLSNTEKYRQPFFENQNIFMEILPYAMIFGVTKKLATAFESMGIQPPQPSWYIGAHAFNIAAFGESMNSFSTSLSSAMASSPSSSGSGGGGFSGGGFGGGGGGSW